MDADEDSSDVNDDEFATNVSFLPEFLDLNEHVAASLLENVIVKANSVSRYSIDAAIMIYYTERDFLLACLNTILKSAKVVSVSQQVKLVCSAFI